MNPDPDQEEELLRSVALQNVRTIVAARQRAEDDLLRAREELSASRERLAAALTAADTGTFRWDLQSGAFDCDENLDRLLGRSQTETPRSLDAFAALVHDEDRARVVAASEEAARDGADLDAEFRVVREDGTLRWFALRGRGPGGPATCLTGACTDISRRKASDERARQGVERLQLALSAGKLGDWWWSAANDRVTLSEPAAHIFGLDPHEPITWAAMRELLAEEHRERARLAVETALATHTDYAIEYRIRRPSGEECWIGAHGRGTYAADGSVLGMLGVVQDVTARRAAEETSQQNAERLRVTFEQAAVGISISQLDGRFTDANQKFADILGYERDELWALKFGDITHPEDAELTRTVVKRLLSGELRDHVFEKRYRRKDGTVFWSLTTVTVIRDAAGNPLHFIGVIDDISRRRQAEDALRDETRVLEVLNRTGATLASQLDIQTLLQVVTDAATELSGAKFGAFFYNTTDENGDAYQLFTLSGAPREAFERFGHPRATPMFAPTFRGEPSIRIDDIGADPRYGQWAPHHGLPPGHLPVVSYLAVPVISRSGEVIGGLFFGHPEVGVFSERVERIITGVAAQAAVAVDNARLYERAQRAAEERQQLLESERMARAHAEHLSAMKDEFLAVLSHELRTPLNAILGWSQMARRHAVEGTLAKSLEVIERNARMQTQLIEDLLDMSRITSGKMRLNVQSIAPFTFIEAAVETVRPAANAKGIRLGVLLDPMAGPIAGDANRLQQVVWNLLSNAIKFTPKGGRVQILLERVNSHIEISVADTGIGISPDFVEHVFERFRQADASTTRKHGGLGLGLAIVKHLVELHGGTVHVQSAVQGTGTTFVIKLPLAAVQRYEDGNPRVHPSAAPLGPAPFQPMDLTGVKVLVVDDEADARDLIAHVLGDCGAEVLLAPSAAEALALVERDRPHVLLSDIGMPDVDGYELLRRVRALGDELGGRLPAIALTAFARSEDRTRALTAGFLVHVSKPIEPSELVATVASVVGRAGP